MGLNAELSKNETFDEIIKTAGDREIDVIIAGPPCQGFSLTGPRNFDDKRNRLYFNSLAKKAIGLDKEILVLLARRKPEYTKSNCKGVG